MDLEELFTKSHHFWSSQDVLVQVRTLVQMITKWFWANHKLSTVLIRLYQKPFASGLANSWWNSQHLGELITNYGFPLPLLQAIILRASQLIHFLGYGELIYHTILGKLQAINGFEISLPRAVCSWISQSLCGLDMVDWLPFVVFSAKH